jgi:hypothetical protein
VGGNELLVVAIVVKQTVAARVAPICRIAMSAAPSVKTRRSVAVGASIDEGGGNQGCARFDTRATGNIAIDGSFRSKLGG